MDGVDLPRRSLFLLRSTAHKLTELRRALRRNGGGGGAFRWQPRTNRASRAPGTPAPASSRASVPFLLELIECALPAHAPQSGRPQLDAVALQLVYLISSGLREAAAGQERRPGLIYRRSAPPTRQKCLAAPSLNTVYCAFDQAHNCSAATREAGAPRPGFNASISSVTAAPEGAGQRTPPPVAIFRFGTRSFVSRFFLDSTSPATDDPRATSAS